MPVIIYEAYDGDPPELQRRKDESLARHAHGLILYKRGSFEEAASVFAELMTEYPEDTVPGMYFRRCQKLMAEPPGPNWQGISRMLMK